MKTTILILAAIVSATCLVGQDAPTPPHTDTRIRVSERVLNDMAVKRVLPQGPWSKDKGHEKGQVTVGVLVDYDGSVKATHFMSGDPLLGDVAQNAVKQWQFRPFILNSQPVQVDSRIVLKFGKKHAEVVVGER